MRMAQLCTNMGDSKDNTTGNLTANLTSNLTSLASLHSMTDHTMWMSELTRNGHKPGNWLAYLTQVETHSLNVEETSRYRFLNLAYNRATKQISLDKYSEDPCYARIIIKFAHLKATQNMDSARTMFKFARANMRKQAMVHLEAAKFELAHGDREKCMNILEKGMKYSADPRLGEALSQVKRGSQIQDQSHSEPMDTCEGPRLAAPVSVCCSSIHPSRNVPDPAPQPSHIPSTMEYVDTTVSFRRPEVGTRKVSTGSSASDDGDTMPINQEGAVQGISAETPDVSGKFGLFGSKKKTSQRKKWTNVAPPVRVIRSSLPQLRKDACQGNKDDDDDDDDDHNDGVQPLKSSPPDERRAGPNVPLSLAPITEKTNESDSGIQTTPTDAYGMGSFPVLAADRPSPMVPGAEPMGVNPTVAPAVPTQRHMSQPVPYPAPQAIQSQAPMQPQLHPQPQSLLQQHMQQHMQPPPQPSPMYQQPYPGMAYQPQQYPVQPVMIPAPQTQAKNMVQVNGRKYSVIKIIGKGGSSKVYQVISEDSKKILALKYVKLDFADEMAMESYMNEITLLQRLKNTDRIIHLYDHEITEDHIYLVMECGSIDLATYLKKRKNIISPNRIWCYWQEMLGAVDVIHKQGIVHSDLKPANFIFVEASLKLIDFGIANAIQSDQTSFVKETQVGTLNYMSPEAIQDTSPTTEVNEYGHRRPRLKINCKSDVWSLGCILYSLVYGRTPFQHITHRILKMQAICNSDHVIDFPAIENKLLLDVMKKCLTRDVRHRPSIEELLNHPYVENPDVPDQGSGEKVSSSVTQEHVNALISQLGQNQINSPRSIARLVQGVVAQINKGEKIDVSSAVGRQDQQQAANQHLAPPPTIAPPMPAPPFQPLNNHLQHLQQLPHHQQHYQQSQPQHHQQPASRLQRVPLRMINSSDLQGAQSLLKPLTQSTNAKYMKASSHQSEKINPGPVIP